MTGRERAARWPYGHHLVTVGSGRVDPLPDCLTPTLALPMCLQRGQRLCQQEGGGVASRVLRVTGPAAGRGR